MKQLKFSEPIKGFNIYQSTHRSSFASCQHFADGKIPCYIVSGVKDFPVAIEGGHVIFTIYDSSRSGI